MSAAAVQSGKSGNSPMKILLFIAKLLITSKRFSKLDEVDRGKPCNAMAIWLHKMQFLNIFLLEVQKLDLIEQKAKHIEAYIEIANADTAETYILGRKVNFRRYIAR